jgi:5S rRNA maturation endonuclease (ribonuclease M5)
MPNTPSPKTNFELYQNSDVLRELGNRLANRGFEDLFDALEVDLRRSGKMFVGTCPIHGGTSANGFNIFPDGDSAKGNWKCRSGECEEVFYHRSPIGFVRGVLSHQKYGWSQKGDDIVSHREAVQYVLDFLGIKIEEAKPDPVKIARHRFVADAKFFKKRDKAKKVGLCTRDELRSYLKMPADYYVGRGYSPDILDLFDVGLCTNRRSPMYGRVIVPVYDRDYHMVVGTIGRTTAPQCPKCDYYHEPTLPCPVSKGDYLQACKWRCSDGFTDKNHFYNFWRSRGPISKSRCMVLVEGPGDVWRLEEAGINIAVATFGNKITDAQRIEIQCSRALHFILVRDQDQGGAAFAEQARAVLTRYGSFQVVEPPTKDVGEMTVDQVRELILPLVEAKSLR